MSSASLICLARSLVKGLPTCWSLGSDVLIAEDRDYSGCRAPRRGGLDSILLLQVFEGQGLAVPSVPLNKAIIAVAAKCVKLGKAWRGRETIDLSRLPTTG